MEYITIYFKEALILLNEMSIYLLFGFLIAGIFHVFVPEKLINKHIGKSNLSSVIKASLLGIPMPLCSCGVIPTAMSFYKNGASKGGTVSFLISTPQTGVDSIMVTYSLLGLPFAILRPIVALFTGIAGGYFANINAKTQAETNTNDARKSTQPKKTLGNMFHYAFVTFLQDISKWLLIGIVIAAFIAVILPDNFFQDYISNDIYGMGLLLIGSIPLYICATGSVPIAMVLMLKGLSPGAALVFLMAGPATNIATMTVIAKVMGKKTLFIYLLSIIIGALTFGYLIDIFLPREWFLFFTDSTHNHANHLLPEWLKTASTALLGLLIINGYIQKYKYKFIKNNTIETKTTDMEQLKIKVEGMTCNHCKANVEKNLMNIEGIANVQADLTSATVAIDGENIDLEKIQSTVESIGYKYIKQD